MLGYTSEAYLDFVSDVAVIVVVNDIVFVLLDDFHGAEHVESVVYTPLYVFEIDFLADLWKERRWLKEG